MRFLKNNKLEVLVFAFAFLMFVNTLTHDYAWDDSIVILENTPVKKGISGIPKLFVKSNSDYKADKYGYRPITLTAFAIEQSVFGNSAKMHHFFNVLYFALLCTLLFKVLTKLFTSYSHFLPLIATLIFAAHPIHCEVVANIKSRDEIFAFLFSLLSLNAMLSFMDKKNVKYIILSIFLFLLAFLSKESAIVFAILIPVSLLYKQNFSGIKKLLKPMAVMMGLLIVCFIIVKTYTSSTVGISNSKGAGIYYESGILGNSFFYTDLITQKLANAFLLLLHYLKNFFWPTHLVYFSGYNQLPLAKWTDLSVIISVALHIGLILFAIINLKKNPALFYSVIFYFCSIAIYLHVFKTLADTMADRFYFVPSIGIILVLFFLSEQFWLKALSKLTLNDVLSGNKKPILKYSLSALLLVLSALTIARNNVWKNTETLITHDMPYLQNCARAHQYYADVLQEKLNSNFDSGKEQEMISHYKKSIEISNESYYAYLKLGMYYTKMNRLPEAENVLNEMMEKFPNQADVHFALGEVCYKAKNYKKAIGFLNESKLLAPEVSVTYFYLSLAQSKEKQLNEALNTITLCEQKFGTNAKTLEVKSEIYYDASEIQKSTDYMLQAINYGADATSVYKTIIGRYQLLKMDKEAMFYYKEAQGKGVL